jgi:CRP-like cAMP-binding protein
VLCKFGPRLEVLGLGEPGSHNFPLRQEQLADTTGLTAIHVNRSLVNLEGRGLIAWWSRSRNQEGSRIEVVASLDL